MLPYLLLLTMMLLLSIAKKNCSLSRASAKLITWERARSQIQTNVWASRINSQLNYTYLPHRDWLRQSLLKSVYHPTPYESPTTAPFKHLEMISQASINMLLYKYIYIFKDCLLHLFTRPAKTSPKFSMWANNSPSRLIMERRQQITSFFSIYEGGSIHSLY